MNVNFPDAVVVLAYFCENDGPRVVMTTQAVPRLFEPPPAQSLRHANIPWDKIAEIQAEAPYTINVLSIMECNKPSNDLTEDKKDELVFGDWDRSVELIDEENRCPACTSLGDDSAHVANDYRMKRSFVSTQTALNDECYMVVKKAIFRAMVSEKLNPLPDTPKDVSFAKPGPSSRSQRLSKLFSLTSNDPNDEGILLFGSDDDNFTAVVRSFILKDAKSRGFQRRYLLMALSTNRDLIVWNYKTIINEFSTTARLLQVAANAVYLDEQKLDKNAVIRTARWLPQEFFRTKIDIDTTRSLEVIINDPKCYTILHRDFVGILQRIFSKNMTHELPDNFLRIQQSAEFSRGFAMEAARDLKIIQRKMKPSIFKILLWHICVGRQLICRSDDPVARKQFLFAFSVILPNDCCNFEPCSKKYKIVGEANLLGLSMNAQLPQKETDDIFIVRLERDPETRNKKSMEFVYYNVIVEHLPDPFEHSVAPTIIQRYLNVLERYDTVKLRPFLHSLVNEKLELMGRTTTIEKTCETTKEKQAYFKLFRYPAADIDVHKFWQRIACRPPPITFELSPIVEELEEDIKFIMESYSIKKSNGHLLHDSKIPNGSAILQRASTLIR